MRNTTSRIKILLFLSIFVVVGFALVMITLSNNKKPVLPEIVANDLAMYEENESGKLYCAVTFNIHNMEKLMLIDIEQDSDEIYLGFEPQFFSDTVLGTGFLVIAWRTDGYVDIYHQPSLSVDPAVYEIAGNGLANMIEVPMEGAFLEVGQYGVDTYFAFEDLKGREIEIRVKEGSTKTRKPFGLLAPIGKDVENPTSMPLVFLKDFYFVRRDGTEVMIKIGDKEHQSDKLPIPIDLSSMYFMRYSPDTLFITFNPGIKGELQPLEMVSENLAVSGQLNYELINNGGHPEITTIWGSNGSQKVEVHFRPSFPNITAIKDGTDLKGQFMITGDASLGMIEGVYELRREENKVFIRMQAEKGWQPYEKKLSANFLYFANKDFIRWPTTYEWQAVINLDNPFAVEMNSKWQRLGE